MSKTIILIGGAPTTGKSTMAQMLAKHLGLPWISTDQIRDLARRVAREEDYPYLFNGSETAEEFLTKHTTQEIVDYEFEQGGAVWPVTKAFIDEDYTWTEGCVIEGVNILPKLVSADFANNPNVHALFLVDEDADRMRDVVFTRGLWGPADSYSDDVKEKEIEWATAFSHRLRKEAEACGLPVVEVTKKDTDLQVALTCLGI